jgi:hypothetical protein
MRPLPAPLLAPVLALAAACLGPQSVTLRYYTLPSGPVAAAPAREPLESLGLGPVTLPPYLDRPEIVTRLSPERIAYSGEDRWAAPLADQFRRALADDLRVAVPAREVVAWPWPRDPAPALAVAVQVQRFESGADGAAVLEARWTVGRGSGGAPLASAEFRARQEPATRDAAGSVGAMGRAVEALAGEIARAVAGLPRR